MALASMRSVRARKKCASERLEQCDAIGRFERLERGRFPDDLDGPNYLNVGNAVIEPSSPRESRSRHT